MTQDHLPLCIPIPKSISNRSSSFCCLLGPNRTQHSTTSHQVLLQFAISCSLLHILPILLIVAFNSLLCVFRSSSTFFTQWVPMKGLSDYTIYRFLKSVYYPGLLVYQILFSFLHNLCIIDSVIPFQLFYLTLSPVKSMFYELLGQLFSMFLIHIAVLI